jgi:hypothetical protein
VRHGHAVWGALLSILVAVAAGAAPERAAVPENLDAALAALEELLPEAEKLEFKSAEESRAVTSAHFGIGRWIRNEWGLWRESPLARYFLALGVEHPDDMSGIILRSFWRRLNGRPLEVQAQASCYQRWWKEYARLKMEAQSRGAASYSPPDFEC